MNYTLKNNAHLSLCSILLKKGPKNYIYSEFQNERIEKWKWSILFINANKLVLRKILAKNTSWSEILNMFIPETETSPKQNS